MVFVAILLLTVSTLAIHGKPTVVSKDCVIIGRRKYCNTPGSSVPQSEIDRSIANNNIISLKTLTMRPHRINMPDLEDGSVEGNCAMDIIPASTLAVNRNILSIDDLVIPKGCENKTFCEEKPVGYPDEEIDRLILERKLTQLHRMKSEADLDIPEIKPGSISGNCETIREMRTPYILKRDGQVPQLLVQSKFFTQSLPSVTCKTRYDEDNAPDIECAGDFIREGSNTKTKCMQKTIYAKLYVYTKDKQIQLVDGEINVDCVCVKK